MSDQSVLLVPTSTRLFVHPPEAFHRFVLLLLTSLADHDPRIAQKETINVHVSMSLHDGISNHSGLRRNIYVVLSIAFFDLMAIGLTTDAKICGNYIEHSIVRL